MASCCRDWRRVSTAKKLPRVPFHALRNTHAAVLIRAGVDILTISRRLGHSKATCDARYLLPLDTGHGCSRSPGNRGSAEVKETYILETGWGHRRFLAICIFLEQTNNGGEPDLAELNRELAEEGFVPFAHETEWQAAIQEQLEYEEQLAATWH